MHSRVRWRTSSNASGELEDSGSQNGCVAPGVRVGLPRPEDGPQQAGNPVRRRPCDAISRVGALGFRYFGAFAGSVVGAFGGASGAGADTSAAAELPEASLLPSGVEASGFEPQATRRDRRQVALSVFIGALVDRTRGRAKKKRHLARRSRASPAHA